MALLSDFISFTSLSVWVAKAWQDTASPGACALLAVGMGLPIQTQLFYPKCWVWAHCVGFELTEVDAFNLSVVLSFWCTWGSPGSLAKTQTAEPHPQILCFSKAGVGSEQDSMVLRNKYWDMISVRRIFTCMEQCWLPELDQMAVYYFSYILEKTRSCPGLVRWHHMIRGSGSCFLLCHLW